MKVYAARLGKLHEALIAAPNKRAAAKALGVKLADVTETTRATHPARAVYFAEQEPGVVFRRLRGTGDKFRAVGQ